MVVENDENRAGLLERAISSLASVYHGSSSRATVTTSDTETSEHVDETMPLKSYQNSKPSGKSGTEGHPEESMMPSANSTNLASAVMARGANWQTLHRAAALRNHKEPPRYAMSEGNLTALPPPLEYTDSSNPWMSAKGYRSLGEKKRKFQLWIVTALLAVAVVACVSLLAFSRNTESGENEDDGLGGLTKYVYGSHSPPFSGKDPTSLPFPAFDRGWGSSPGQLLGRFGHGVLEDGKASDEEVGRKAIPTNSWFQSLLILDDGAEPDGANRAYVIPYVVDTVGPTPGLRMYPTSPNTGDLVIQMITIENHGLTVGATSKAWDPANTKHRYEIFGDEGKLAVSPTACALKWDLEKQPLLSPVSPDAEANFVAMTSTIARGMPFSTMHYHLPAGGHLPKGDLTVLPTVSAEVHLWTPPVVDDDKEMTCVAHGEEDASESFYVDREVSLEFIESDFRWLVFFSHPVYVKCVKDTPKAALQLKVVSFPPSKRHHQGEDDHPFTVRVGLADACARGESALHCSRDVKEPKPGFDHLLRKHADIYPGYYGTIAYDFVGETSAAASKFDTKVAHLIYNWDARNMRKPPKGKKKSKSVEEPGLLMFAMNHQFEGFVLGGEASITKPWPNCVPTLLGPTCLVQGSTWRVQEDLQYKPSGIAPRPPRKSDLKDLADALKDDIHFQIDAFFLRGAGDTYFSGKMLAKLGRILLITDELRSLKNCNSNLKQRWRAGVECAPSDLGYTDADVQEVHQAIEGMADVELPSDDDFNAALDQLRQGVQVWINGKAEAPFLYDKMWGGVVNCGCHFNGEIMGCANKYPDCPSFGDPGLNFGNGYYNDHHFHYGYHIYSAAIVAKFDPEWGREHFENVLMLIRDIANPSPDDYYFPLFRHKDWYTGNSWASGIIKPPMYNGRNQESSSEAIAAYEGVALYGSVMSDAFRTAGDRKNSVVAKHVRDIGRLMTVTELRAAQRYWHVLPKGDPRRVYGDGYGQTTVGMIWSLMVQFGTFFGGSPFLVIGIQLLPLTPISEDRDELGWVARMYPELAETCEADNMCTEQGWAILQFATMATIGHRAEAIRRTKELPSSAFTSAGGNGHSLSNTIWYISTRPGGKDKGDDGTTSLKPSHDGGGNGPVDPDAIDCGCPDTCTRSVLLGDADGHTCKDRMVWLMWQESKTEEDACRQVAGDEFSDVCGKCNPDVCEDMPPTIDPCPPCPVDICTDTNVNQCDAHVAPYLCLEGGSKGGCSRTPWVGFDSCSGCCEVIPDCPEVQQQKAKSREIDVKEEKKEEKRERSDRCPPCPVEICTDPYKNQCNPHAAPYLCLDGGAIGGCSGTPWPSESACVLCCEVIPDCPEVEEEKGEAEAEGEKEEEAAVQAAKEEESEGEKGGEGEEAEKRETSDRCPPCPVDICTDPYKNQCNPYAAPYLCLDGGAIGGCSPTPWPSESSCVLCCQVIPDCPGGGEEKGEGTKEEDVEVQAAKEEEEEKEDKGESSNRCPPCSVDICTDPYKNQCDPHAAPYLCLDGGAVGGCSPTPWPSESSCVLCCQVIPDCPGGEGENGEGKKEDEGEEEKEEEKVESGDRCPPCPVEICTDTNANQCDAHVAPYLCLDGGAVGGCSATPWPSESSCVRCCQVIPDCPEVESI